MIYSLFYLKLFLVFNFLKSLFSVNINSYQYDLTNTNLIIPKSFQYQSAIIRLPLLTENLVLDEKSLPYNLYNFKLLNNRAANGLKKPFSLSVTFLLLPAQIQLLDTNLKQILIISYGLTGLLVAFFLYVGTLKIKKLKNVLRKQKETLKQQSADKSRLFTNVSHQLRIPITSIRNPINLAIKSVSNNLPEDVKSKLKTALKNTRILKSLLDDLEKISRHDNGETILNLEIFNLHNFLQQVARQVQESANQKAIDFCFQLNLTSDTTVILDKGKLEKIINDLLICALGLQGSGRKIGFLVSMVENRLNINVSNTGSRSSFYDLSHLFDRNKQGYKAKAKEKFDMAERTKIRKLIHLMKGQIIAERTFGQNSSFIFEIPCNVLKYWKPLNNSSKEAGIKEKVVNSADTSRDTLIRKQTILIVENQPDKLLYIARLQSDGFRVMKVINGMEALKFLEKEPVHLIIADVEMPEMDGYTFLNHLKNHSAYNKIPVVMLTDLEERKNIQKELLLGVDDYLIRPFTIEELQITVRKLIERLNVREQIAQKESDETVVQNHSQSTGSSSNANFELLKQLETLIRDNVENTHFQLGELSTTLCLSERQLRRKTKKITGLGPKKYQQEIQLQMAREMLKSQTCDNIKAVALSVGMNHVTRFSQLYLDRFGRHPYSYFSPGSKDDNEFDMNN